MASALRLFVYGTLKPGQPNYARYLSGKTLAETPATLCGGSLYTEGPWPYLVVAPALVRPPARVYGTLVTIAPQCYQQLLAALDWLEDYRYRDPANLYERVAWTVSTQAGPAAAWVYLAGLRPTATIRAGGMRLVFGGSW